MFEGVLINDTFVLGWHREAEQLVFAVEASLWPEHPDYEPPRPNEWTCYKRARLVFEGVSSVEGLPDMASAPRCTDADGSQCFGSLDELAPSQGATGSLVTSELSGFRRLPCGWKWASGPNPVLQQTATACPRRMCPAFVGPLLS
jgi:hypothetical protein